MFEEKMNRLMAAVEAKTDSDLARALEITPPSVASARAKMLVPVGWIEKISTTFNVSMDWIYYGRGPMRPDTPVPTAQDSAPAPQTAPGAPVAAQESACAACVELKSELDMERGERRELTGEVRQITVENRQLWKENAALREKVARLEGELNKPLPGGSKSKSG